MFNKIIEFLFCADIIKTPKVFCLTFGVHVICLKRPDVFKKARGLSFVLRFPVRLLGLLDDDPLIYFTQL